MNENEMNVSVVYPIFKISLFIIVSLFVASTGRYISLFCIHKVSCKTRQQ